MRLMAHRHRHVAPMRGAIAACIIGITLSMSASLLPARTAYASEVDDAQAEYDEAMSRYEKLQGQSDETQRRLDELTEAIPTTRQRAADAVRSIYMRDDAVGMMSIVSALMSSDTLDDAITIMQYDNRIAGKMSQSISDLEAQLSEAKTTKNDLEAQLNEAQKAVDDAQDALTKAKEAADAEQRAAQTANVNAGGSSGSASAVGMEEVDWSVDEETFVNEWAPRIDAYLNGWALAGQGETFARAAYRYGVDPRWSPAISCVESSRGNICFKKCNAWGWGSSSWSSWEEAIDAHVSGLAAGYGSFPTLSAARKYCPPNANHWYSTCISEMSKI